MPTQPNLTVEALATFCKKKGFVFKSSEIYGGLAGVHDYGFLGVELKRAVMDSWWRRFVTGREDIVGLDGAILSSAKIWEASGHTQSFNDPLVTDRKTGKTYRADHLIEDALGIPTDGKSVEELASLIREHKLTSPEGNELSDITTFNLMFPVQMGSRDGSASLAYLRGEIAQIIFANFRNVLDTGRVKLPFGIAQMGKAFRNEISPREFLYRQREFEILEIEYFYAPGKEIDYTDMPEHAFRERTIRFLSKKHQDTQAAAESVRIGSLIEAGTLNEVHAYWLAESIAWFESLGLTSEKLRVREHLHDELSHYSRATFDIEYEFPFGYKEIFGIADRTDYDLRAHQERTGKSMEVFDDEQKEKILPHVIEPSFGLDRTLLALLFDAYDPGTERGNIVLRLTTSIAPIQVAILPLKSNEPELVRIARAIHRELLDAGIRSYYDKSGSIGRRYARQDEIGTPYAITIDHQTLEDGTVTLRDRNTTHQNRLKREELENEINGRNKNR